VSPIVLRSNRAALFADGSLFVGVLVLDDDDSLNKEFLLKALADGIDSLFLSVSASGLAPYFDCNSPLLEICSGI
jgi:hypothetical protein